jgi:hypothetical protein
MDVNPEALKKPACWLAITNPNLLEDGRYTPVFTSPENLMDGTAKLPFPTVKLVIVLAEPEAAL